jgi:hypothetical protein
MTVSGATLCPGGLFGSVQNSLAVINLINSVVAVDYIMGGTNAFWADDRGSTVNVSNCYARNDLSLANQTGGTLDIPANLQLKSLYTTLGWDLANVWASLDGRYPALRIRQYVITADEAGTEAAYLSGDYSDIVISSDASGNVGQFTVSSTAFQPVGAVIYKKVIAAKQWYPIGFPYVLSGIYYDDPDGRESLNAYVEGTGGDYWLKSCTTTTAAFAYTTTWTAGQGYAIQFPTALVGAEIVFVSEDSPVLTNSSTITAGSAYQLLAAPVLNTIDDVPAFVGALPSNCYLYLFDGDKGFKLYESGSASIQPFESFVVINTGAGGALKSISIEDSEGQTTGVGQVSVYGKLISEKYYTLQGVEVLRPVRGGIYIVKRMYDSNQVETKKVTL